MSPLGWRIADGHLVFDRVAEAPRNRLLHGDCIGPGPRALPVGLLLVQRFMILS